MLVPKHFITCMYLFITYILSYRANKFLLSIIIIAFNFSIKSLVTTYNRPQVFDINGLNIELMTFKFCARGVLNS